MKKAIAYISIFIFGAWLGPLLYFFKMETLISWLVDEIQQLAILFTILILSSLLLFLFRENITKMVFGTVRNRPQRIFSAIIEAIDERNIARIETEESAKKNALMRSRELSSEAVEEAGSYLFWAMGIRSVIGLLIGILATFAATLGTFLLFSQNKIMEKQAELLINQQNEISEQKTQDLYLQITDLLSSNGNGPAAEARANLLFPRLQVLDKKAPEPYLNRDLDLARCRDVKVGFMPQNVRSLLSLGLNGDLVPSDLVDASDYRQYRGSDAVKVIESINIDRAILDDVEFVDSDGLAIDSNNRKKLNLGEFAILNSTFAGSDLFSIELEGGNISNSCFEGAILTASSFVRTAIADTSFDNAKLSYSDLSEGPRLRTTFRNAELGKSIFSDQTLRDVDFSSSDLSFSRFGAEDKEISLFNVKFNNANLTGVVFSHVRDWENVSFDDACAHPDFLPCFRKLFINLRACGPNAATAFWGGDKESYTDATMDCKAVPEINGR